MYKAEREAGPGGQSKRESVGVQDKTFLYLSFFLKGLVGLCPNLLSTALYSVQSHIS